MSFNSPRLLGDLSGYGARGPWLSVGLLALPGALGREPHANQKRMENLRFLGNAAQLRAAHSSFQTRPQQPWDEILMGYS